MSGPRQMLTDITRGMHHAASTTAAMLAQQYLRVIDQFFDTEADGTMTAKMVKVWIDSDHYMMVPLISMVSPKGLALERLEVEMTVRIDEATVKKATDTADNSEATRSSFSVTMSPKSNVLGRRSDMTDIKMVFTAGEPPEGFSRLIDEYTNQIQPRTSENGKDGTGVKSAGPNGMEPTTYHTIGKEGLQTGAYPALEPETDDPILPDEAKEMPPDEKDLPK